MPFAQALFLDLIGAPEFFFGVYAAEWFRKSRPHWRSTPRGLMLALLLFALTGLLGTGLRTVLFGQPAPGFLSFGFGFTLLTARQAESHPAQPAQLAHPAYPAQAVRGEEEPPGPVWRA